MLFDAAARSAYWRTVEQIFNGPHEKEAFAVLKRGNGARALELFKEMAALGSPVACLCIGDIYFYGIAGVQQDPNESKKWYRHAVDSSVPIVSQSAALKLGYICEAGYDETNKFGAKIDNEKAFAYYKRLEDSDNAIGLLRLGIMYELGKGTAPDPGKARALYRRAAWRHVVALKNLASLKVRSGETFSGYLLWVAAIIEAIFFSLFKRTSRRIAVV